MANTTFINGVEYNDKTQYESMDETILKSKVHKLTKRVESGKKITSAMQKIIVGMLLIIVNLAFLLLTIFVADKWWYGVVTFFASYLIQIIYGLIRPLLMLAIPNIWSLIEIVSGITLPILSFIYLFS